ncbi:hypothetical protein RQP46_002480 [Phenoliferia psychrophenolica]
MASAEQPERQLSDLNDLEIAEMTRALKDSEASSRPLVGALEPIASLADEYEGAPTFLAKIAGLGQDGWTGVRRLRGDGDCFYRAFAFAYVERLLKESPAAAKTALDKVESLLPLLDQANYAKDIYDDFYDPLRVLLTSLSPTSTSRPTAASLLTSFNDPETSNSIVVFLRLVTSAYLKANSDDFVPFLFGLEDDPRFFESGTPTLDEFCSFYVEITALTRALEVDTRIAYLDQSGAGLTGFAGEGTKVDFHEFQPESAVKLGCVSQIKAATNHLNETFVMRIKIKEWVVDSRRPEGRWAVSKNYVEGVGEQDVVKLRLGTWNIWFDTHVDCDSRWTHLFDTVLSEREGEQLDVVCLQEVTQRSFGMLLERKDVRSAWMIVDFADVLERTSSWYGTTILVRKSWMAKSGLDHVEASLTRYEGPMGRSLLALEFSNASGIALRIGTSHWESGTEDMEIRKRQFLTAARLFAFPSSFTITEEAPPAFPVSVDDLIAAPTFTVPANVPTSILVGDTNITFTAELSTLTAPPLSYVDAFDSLHPIKAGEDPYTTHPTFYTTYPSSDPARRADLVEKRIDYVLVREGEGKVEITEARLIGNDPILDSNGGRKGDPRGRDGAMYPSDHLGVVVAVSTTRGKGV